MKRDIGEAGDPSSTSSLHNLIYLHDAPVPASAANSVQVVRMCQAFRRAGANVKLIALSGAADGNVGFPEIARFYGLEDDAPFEFRTVRISSLPGWKLLLGVIGALERSHAERPVVYTRSISAATSAACLGKPVALEMHQPISAHASYAKRFERLIRRSAFRHLIVISEALKHDYLKYAPDLAGRILVAHDGANVVNDRVSPTPLDGDFKVGYVGHLYPGKGMEVIERLAPICPWATFHIVGGTEECVINWRGRLAKETNVVLHGHVPPADAASYIAAMDVVVAPYLRVVKGSGGGSQDLAAWMSPLKLFEYMAHGKAILASDLPVLREVLTNRMNALLRPPEDIAGWAADLKELCENSALKTALGDAARADLETNYTWSRRAKSILEAVYSSTSEGISRSSLPNSGIVGEEVL